LCTAASAKSPCIPTPCNLGENPARRKRRPLAFQVLRDLVHDASRAGTSLGDSNADLCMSYRCSNSGHEVGSLNTFEQVVTWSLFENHPWIRQVYTTSVVIIQTSKASYRSKWNVVSDQIVLQQEDFSELAVTSVPRCVWDC